MLYVDFKVKFDQIYGLKGGDRVIYELNHIGDVKNVFYEKGGIYNVDVTIESNFTNAITEYSKFFIIDDPIKEGEKAIEVLGEKSEFDMAIIDLTNKLGMGGKELNEIIGEKYPNIKTIVISGYSTDAILSNYEKYGFDDKLLKPFSIQDLISKINSLISEI